MVHQFLTHWFQQMIDSLVVLVVWVSWILGHISFPKFSSWTPGILSLQLWNHFLPIHFRVSLLYLFHLEPKALDLETFFHLWPRVISFIFTTQSSRPKVDFNLWPRVISFLFRVQSSRPRVIFHLWPRVISFTFKAWSYRPRIHFHLWTRVISFPFRA